jgi:plasmid stabilization system protein ParE
MKTVRFHPAAESEMIAAAVYYEQQQAGLGRRFLSSVQDAINRILINPHLYPIIEHDTRRCLAKVFPFGIIYRERTNRITIVSIMHLHRDPNYWKNR